MWIGSTTAARLVFRSVPGENRRRYLRARCAWFHLWPAHPSPGPTTLTAASAARFTPLAFVAAAPRSWRHCVFLVDVRSASHRHAIRPLVSWGRGHAYTIASMMYVSHCGLPASVQEHFYSIARRALLSPSQHVRHNIEVAPPPGHYIYSYIYIYIYIYR